MQKIVLEEPYVPVPPRHGSFWSHLFGSILPWFLRKNYGVVEFEFVHLDRLRASLRARHGILLMPNHCRDEDGLVMGMLSCKIGQWFYYMSSWHVFKLDAVKAFLLPRLGLYSVYREGPDRASVKMSVDMLVQARRPLVIFPEGFLARTNDRLGPLMDGPALIARAAAKKRAQSSPPGQVVVHPVALRYHLRGPFEPGVLPVLAALEARLGLASGDHLNLRERIDAIDQALQARWESENLGTPQTGPLPARRARLIQALLHPLEDEWLGQRHDHEPVQARVRQLRVAIVPGLATQTLAETERQRRWQQLAAVYLAQQLDNYPADYLANNPPLERLLETIERFEEDTTDKLRPFVPLKVTVTIGEAIIVSPVRSGRGDQDPMLREVENQLRSMLGLTQVAVGSQPAAAAAAV